ncbi:DEAD/DEAH box helicase [Gordonia polyisoprenivorans]|uniref:DEAD/DEAH box helicase n=1 Tax=Gordonia polyisoprenivorans TaxID=84595 RepID=UPI0023019487|nr:DEAD/DEAH box helicase family protein [Gordonia polyisoprenivorans]WCB37670.1 DEAD/DEAH box helicase [Gordonia polyisoprenivorans]
MQSLGDSVLDEITRVGPLTSVELAERLSQTVTAVQKVLLENDQVFVEPAEGADAWNVVSPDDMARRLGMNRALRPWQVEAFQKWVAAERSGVVEAVTGAGKTDVGVAAIADARRRGVPALVLLPDRDLADQWRGVLEGAFPGVKIGTPHATRALAVSEQIVVTTVEGLGKKRLTAFRDVGLLVVDEIQRFGIADVTEAVFPRVELTERLGLTASYGWSNPQADRVLRPYFGDRIDGCGYPRAVAEGILAEPLVLTVGVSFSAQEHVEYEALSRKIESAEQKLRDTGVDLSAGVYETAREIDAGSLVGEISFLAKGYLDAVEVRRRVMSECKAKVAAVEVIARGVGDARRTTVFTTSDEMSVNIAKAARNSGVVVEAVVGRKDASFLLGRYQSGSVDLLVTSRLLDEGVAVPTSQVGIVTAAARTSAQMLQRMGRVVHPADWAERTAMVVVYVNGTIEDPDVDSLGETHLDELMPIAAEREDVGPREAAKLLGEWLAGGSVEETSVDDEVSTVPVVEPESWEPREAILDIVEEYQGLATWAEIRELLPDLEVETALMAGIDELTWMRVGNALVGIGGRTAEPTDDRVIMLDSFARAFSSLGATPTDIHRIRQAVGGGFAEGLSDDRLGEFWDAVGGRIAVFDSHAQPEASEQTVTDEDLHEPGTPAPVDTPETLADVDEVASSPALAAVLDQFRSRGWRALRGPGHPGSTVVVTNQAGIQKVVRVHSGMGGNWRINTHDQDLSVGHAEHDAIIFLDRATLPPKFYIAPVGPYAKRVKAVIEARAKSNPRERLSAHVNIESWVVQDGLDRWDLLGLDETTKAADDGVVVPDGPAEVMEVRDEQIPTPVSPGLQWSEDNELRVVLDYEGHRVVGFFDPQTKKLRIAVAQGATKLVGKEFRNPAVAAGTVKSRIAKRTVFGVGFNDWVVDENTRETLAGFLEAS